jgi:GAF domain-containing protein
MLPVAANNLDILIGCVLLASSLFGFLGRKLNFEIRSQVIFLGGFILLQLTFIRLGWSGLPLLFWILFNLAAGTLLTNSKDRLWLGVNLAAFLCWTGLSVLNLSTRVVLITQVSLILDVIVILAAAITGVFLVSSLRKLLAKKEEEIGIAMGSMQDQASAFQTKTEEFQIQMARTQTAAAISRSLASILNPNRLIQQAAEEIKSAFDLYYVGVFLIDTTHEFAVLRYGTGEEGKRMVANRHRLAVGGFSMIGWTTQNRQPRIALDVGEDAIHFDNPDLPETRSELTVPILTPNGILGALSIQSKRENAFPQRDVALLQQITDALGIALENANTFESTQKALDDLRVINKAFVQKAWGEEISSVGEMKVEYENPLVPPPAQEISHLKVPLLLRDEVIGYIHLEIEGNELNPDQQEFLETISAQTSTALENARLIDATQRSAAREQQLNEFATQFSRALTIEEILKTAVTEFGNLPSVFEASIALLPPEEFTPRQPIESDSEVS